MGWVGWGESGGRVKRSLGTQSLVCPRGSDVLWSHFTPHSPVFSVESRTWAGRPYSGTSSPRRSSQPGGKAQDPEVQDPRPGSPAPATQKSRTRDPEVQDPRPRSPGPAGCPGSEVVEHCLPAQSARLRTPQPPTAARAPTPPWKPCQLGAGHRRPLSRLVLHICP